MSLFPWFLFAHILGAIIAFGPSFSMPIIGAMGGKEREHSNFATRVSEQIAKIQIFPLALLQGITGVALIITGGIDVFAHAWLLTAIVLYVIAIGYSYFVQTPAVRKVIEMTMPRPTGAPAAGAPAAGAPAAGGPPAGGPPAELLATIKKVQRGGGLLAVLVIAIVFLMVLKPF